MVRKSNLKPKISLVIPLYNSQRTIEKTLDSIYKNTFKNFEVIIVDDSSTDSSVKLLKKYPVKLFQQKNAGPSKARNFGVENSKSDLILFIDSDIVIPNTVLKKIYGAFKNNNINIFSGMCDSENHYINKISDYENLYLHYQFARQKKTTTSFNTSLIAIRKSLFTKFGGFKERMRMCEDMDFGQRMLNVGHTIYLDREIEFAHLKNYTFFSYVQKQFKKTVAILKIKLRDIKGGTISKKSYDASLMFQLGIPLSLLVPLGLVASVIFVLAIPLYIAVLTFITLILINNKMLSYMYNKRDFRFFITSCFILLVNYWINLIGMCYGITTFILGKEY